MKFKLDNQADDDNPYVAIAYEYEPTYPLYGEGQNNDVWRLTVGLDAHSTPWISAQYARTQARLMTLRPEEFSAFVDALIKLRDRLPREAAAALLPTARTNSNPRKGTS